MINNDDHPVEIGLADAFYIFDGNQNEYIYITCVYGAEWCTYKAVPEIQ